MLVVFLITTSGNSHLRVKLELWKHHIYTLLASIDNVQHEIPSPDRKHINLKQRLDMRSSLGCGCLCCSVLKSSPVQFFYLEMGQLATTTGLD
jgi:hypothetical protein